MPRSPATSRRAAAQRGSLYSAFPRRAAAALEVYPLHIGDTWMEPAVGCRMEDLGVCAHPGMHRYDPPWGRPALVEGLASRCERLQGVSTRAEHVLVGAGATGVLAGVVAALVEEGDEVVVLAPHWPLVVGQIRLFGGRPVSVPFYQEPDLEAALALVRGAITHRTVALSLNSPNNPTGRVLPRAWLEALVDLARSHDLWILADEVYEDYAWGGQHLYTRSLAPERTFSIHSASKAWGMAGNRCGYGAGPAEVMSLVRRVTTHTFYSAPTASQLAALRALEGHGDAWAARAAALYRDLGREAAATLGVLEPEGGTFLFLDIAAALAGRPLDDFLGAAADRGLLVAPGPTFGPYPTSIRVCFTSAPPEVTRRGLALLARMLDARGG